MRILCVSNYYPPFEIGGEEQTCLETVHALQARGHQVSVITSTHGQKTKLIAPNVYRILHPEMELDSPLQPLRFFLQRKQIEHRNLTLFRQILESIHPDAVFFWGMWNLHRSIPSLAESLMPGRVLYRFGDYWPSLPSQNEFYWRAMGRSPLSRLVKAHFQRTALMMLSRDGPLPQLKFEHTYCISQGMKQELLNLGIPVQEAQVIHNGLDTQIFRPSGEFRVRKAGKLSLLYAGRIVPEKGVHTALQALGELASYQSVSLSLVGSVSSEYEAQLLELVNHLDLEKRISFYGVATKDQMPSLMQSFDGLVFPSIWPEPFGRVLIEAMACSLAVLCTPVGGVPEIVTDDENGLYFAPENASDLARQIRRLLEEPGLYDRLSSRARQTVEERFSIQMTIDRVEAYLHEIVG